MTASEFNEKYKAYISEGFDGLEFDIPEITDYLDKYFDKGLVELPDFQFQQIKMKFGMCRFYFTCALNVSVQSLLQFEIENGVDKIFNPSIC